MKKALKSQSVLHKESYERKIEYNTLAKEAIRIKTLNEILSEEMRILYVALTRAKEKLIITGCDKNLEKSLLEKRNIVTNSKNNKLNLADVRKSKSYLDWIELVYENSKEELVDRLELKSYNKEKVQDIFSSKEKKIENNIQDLLENEEEKVNQILNWEYDYLESTKLEGKTSVTKITKDKENRIEITTKPKFLNKDDKLNGSQIGTLMHLILQNIDFRNENDSETVKQLINKLILSNIINKEHIKYINIEKILRFIQSDLYKDLQNAKQIFKEKPFYIYISADEIYKNKIDEKILVQGIIDLYYINNDDKLILVDYKTDFVADNNEQELVDKYKGQLYIYKRALEKSLNKEVEAVYIYSTCLDKEILI